MKKLTNEKFIEKAISIHGNSYKYELVNYVNNKIKIKIECFVHGIYEQAPLNHLKGLGCPECAHIFRFKTKQQFLQDAFEIHGNRYSYLKINYIDDKIKIEIICEFHGSFWQMPNSHLQGQNCPKCSCRYNKTTEQFIRKARIIHGDLYGYELVDYISNKIRVRIICYKHGDFWQKPNAHLDDKNGCPQCFGFLPKTNDIFIREARIIHGDLYGYELVDYKNNKIKVSIICYRHGIFDQNPKSHLNGSGCPHCSYHISKPEIEWLNSLNVQNDKSHRQISLKINNKLIRADAFDQKTNTIYEFYGDYWHGNPLIYKLEDYNKIAHKTFGELYQKTIEREEILKQAGYNLVTIWESDWKKQIKE